MTEAIFGLIGVVIGGFIGEKGLVKTSMDSDYNNNYYSVIQLSELGEDWLINNQDQFKFKAEKKQPFANTSQSTMDESPF